jgi:hypothetical protein
MSAAVHNHCLPISSSLLSAAVNAEHCQHVITDTAASNQQSSQPQTQFVTIAAQHLYSLCLSSDALV